MPHLTLQISPGGPLVDVLVTASEERREALRRVGQPIPQPIQVRALIDTGASCTCVDPAVLRGLGLTPTGSTPIHTPSTGGALHNAEQYDVCIIFRNPEISLELPTVPVVAAELQVQGIQALLGRDVLTTCLLVYNGQRGFFTLAY